MDFGAAPFYQSVNHIVFTASNYVAHFKSNFCNLNELCFWKLGLKKRLFAAAAKLMKHHHKKIGNERDAKSVVVVEVDEKGKTSSSC